MSPRKLRQQERLAPETLAVRGVRELCALPFVTGVEDELQGQWNELCFFVRLVDAAGETEIATLRAALENHLHATLPRGGTAPRWSVGFWKGDELVGSVVSGDAWVPGEGD